MTDFETLKLVIFDKDGTLTETLSGERFVQHPEDQKLRPGIYERLEQLHRDGVMLAIATNQGGVAANFKTLADAEKELVFARSLLPRIVQRSMLAYMCPDLEGKECWELQWNPLLSNEFKNVSDEGTDFRKGGPGMLKLAMKRHSLTDPSECLMIGDRPEDEEAAKAAGMHFEWA